MGSLLHLLSSLHPKWGLPVKHSGHSHLGAWLMTRHSALTPHAALREHGLMHIPRLLLHVLSSVQSLSLLHEPDVSQRHIDAVQRFVYVQRWVGHRCVCVKRVKL